MRIPLVEDDTALGDTIQAWLRLDGHAVDWVCRGDPAESALLAHTYDCVLLDRGLPGLSGDALLAALRTAGNTVPVILIGRLGKASGFDHPYERAHPIEPVHCRTVDCSD